MNTRQLAVVEGQTRKNTAVFRNPPPDMWEIATISNESAPVLCLTGHYIRMGT